VLADCSAIQLAQVAGDEALIARADHVHGLILRTHAARSERWLLLVEALWPSPAFCDALSRDLGLEQPFALELVTALGWRVSVSGTDSKSGFTVSASKPGCEPVRIRGKRLAECAADALAQVLGASSQRLPTSRNPPVRGFRHRVAVL
jgi:hypothetical protein